MTLTLNSPLDMHLHLRDGAMLELVAPLTSQSFAGAIVMPNLVPPVTTLESLIAYRDRIQKACREDVFEPLMTLFFLESYTKEFLTEAKPYIAGIKLYPSGITTNSEGGVAEIDAEKLAPVLDAMAELKIPLCVHGETNGFVMDREQEFGSVYEALATRFPKLTIIMEHITTAHSVSLLDKYENLYATITLHHLFITLDDVVGGMMDPHLFCKPIAKRPEDKAALLKVALNAHPKVMFGSDSAPHPTHKKECCGCAAGVFTAPLALPALAQLFEAHGKLENLQAFVSDSAQKVYGYQPLEKKVVLVKKPMNVPVAYQDVTPMFAGKTLEWSFQ